MKRRPGLFVIALALLCLAAPVVAHHSFSVEYDVKKPEGGK